MENGSIMKHHLAYYNSDLNEFRIHSAGSDAFGPKIVSADSLLPGTPMDHRSSVEEDLNRADMDVPNYTNGGGSSTKLSVRNELSERRRSLEYVNRPPSPSHFIQFQAAAAAGNNNKEATYTEDSPMVSPKDHPQHHHHPKNTNFMHSTKNGGGSIINGEKGAGAGAGFPGQETMGLQNGMIHNSPPSGNVPANTLGSNGSNKDQDREVSLESN